MEKMPWHLLRLGAPDRYKQVRPAILPAATARLYRLLGNAPRGMRSLRNTLTQQLRLLMFLNINLNTA